MAHIRCRCGTERALRDCVPCAVSLPVRDRTVRCLTAGERSQLVHIQRRDATYRAQCRCQCAFIDGSHPVQMWHGTRTERLRTVRSFPASVRSPLVHIWRRRAMYRAESHCQCAIATGDRNWFTSSVYMPRTARSHRQCADLHQVQTCHVPCAVSLPVRVHSIPSCAVPLSVRDRPWPTSSAAVPRTMRSLTAGARSQLAHIKCIRATYRARSHGQWAIATVSPQVHTCHVPCVVSLTPSARSELALLKCRSATYPAQSHCQCAIATGSSQVRITPSAGVPRTVRSLTANARSQLAHVTC